MVSWNYLSMSTFVNRTAIFWKLIYSSVAESSNYSASSFCASLLVEPSSMRQGGYLGFQTEAANPCLNTSVCTTTPQLFAVASASGQVKGQAIESNATANRRFAWLHAAPGCHAPPLHVVHGTVTDSMRVGSGVLALMPSITARTETRSRLNQRANRLKAGFAADLIANHPSHRSFPSHMPPVSLASWPSDAGCRTSVWGSGRTVLSCPVAIQRVSLHRLHVLNSGPLAC